MYKKDFIQLNDRIYLIDGFDLGVPERTGTYVFGEEELTLVNTGPSPSVKYVKQGLEALGFSLGYSFKNARMLLLLYIREGQGTWLSLKD